MADKLLERHAPGLDRILVVVPSRRAALHLRKYLAERSGKALWSPEILDPGAFMERVAGMRRGSQPDLLIELHRCHQAQHGTAAESLAEFLESAPATLRDISDADNHLLNLDDLYRDLRNYHEIEEWSFRTEKELSTTQAAAISRWKETADLHRRFSEAMIARGVGTAGAIAGQAARLASTGDWQPPWSAVWAVGLNALEPALLKVFEALKQRSLLQVCWDADGYYLHRPENEAGRFIREGMRQLGAGEVATTDGIGKRTRRIDLISLPDRMAECRYAAQWALDLRPDARSESAIVLADEQLLQPLLNAMPSEIGHLNVSMGLPVQDLPVHGLVNQFIRLRSVAPDRLEVKAVCTLLSHPLLHGGDSSVNLVQRFMRSRSSQVSVADAVAAFAAAGLPPEACRALLCPANDTDRLLQSLYEWILAVQPGNNLVREQVYQLTLLDRELRQALARSGAPHLDPRDFALVRERLMGQGRINLFGEPLQGLQVLGMLETRALSFRQVLILGASEGMLIGRDEPSSWIPFDVRRHHGLPLRADADAVASYHVHRLMQGADVLALAHAPAADGSGSPARFIDQWEHELAPVSNTFVRRLSVGAAPRPSRDARLAIPKDEAVTEGIRRLLAEGISPTALGTWLRCPMDFHAKYLLGVRASIDDNGQLADDVLGTAAHKAIERIYHPWLNRPLEAVKLMEAAARAEESVTQALMAEVPEELLTTGSHLLRGSMAGKALRRMLESEAAREDLTQTVPLAVEQRLRAELRPGAVIKGSVDRLERRNGVLCVLDIKTGSFREEALKLKGLDRGSINHERRHALQLLMYAAMCFHEDPGLDALRAGIVPMRKPGSGEGAWLSIMGESTIRRELLPDIDALLLQIIDEMLDPAGLIAHDPDSEYCECCVP